MNDFHAKLLAQIIKHGSEEELSHFIQGIKMPVFWRGDQCGEYRGGQMFVTDQGCVDADPASIDKVTFVDPISEDIFD